MYHLNLEVKEETKENIDVKQQKLAQSTRDRGAAGRATMKYMKN